jgi:hypothetical protein
MAYLDSIIEKSLNLNTITTWQKPQESNNTIKALNMYGGEMWFIYSKHCRCE